MDWPICPLRGTAAQHLINISLSLYKAIKISQTDCYSPVSSKSSKSKKSKKYTVLLTDPKCVYTKPNYDSEFITFSYFRYFEATSAFIGAGLLFVDIGQHCIRNIKHRAEQIQ